MNGGGRRAQKRRGGMGLSNAAPAPDYHQWSTAHVEARGVELELASKPGAPGNGELDPATGLLLDHLEMEDGERLLDLQCGAGALGAFATLSWRTAGVEMLDRNLVAVQAARHTLAANQVTGAEVLFASVPGPSSGPFDVASIRLPQGRLPTLQLIWSAFQRLRPGGRCYIAGANDEGIRTAHRQVEDIFGGLEVLGYRGGNRIGVAIRPTDGPPSAQQHAIPWPDADHFHRFIADTPDGELEIHSRPGVFSWDRLDSGSVALMECMEIAPGASVLELGCGYGVVGMAAARRSGSGRVVLVDVDADAVRASRRSVAANGLQDRVNVLASDVGQEVQGTFQTVLANPPFHLQKSTNLEIPAQFIRDARRLLEPGGRLYLVANRTLPYERWIREAFGSLEVARDGREFKVLTARAAR